MFRRTSLSLSVLVAVFALTFCTFRVCAQDDNSHRGRKFKAPPPSSRIEISVIRDSNGKPVEHAAVIFHPIEGDRDKGILELKTNEDGKAVVDVIPVGDTVRLQIIAKGFQTYGGDFKVDKNEISMEVRLKRPGQQYSIYRNNGEAAKSDNGSEDNSQKSAEKPSGQTPPKQQ
jgi:hypothetical protein